MAIKAIFPSDKESITVTGLYQWDYGQQLEIEAEGLPEVIEVHFSCTNMTEAIVRTCVRDENGVYIAAIPDDCLEQATPITAWIYDFSVTQGKTVKVITLPVVARTRPSVTREVSADDADQLATLITELNTAVEGLKNGDIVAKKAESANTAISVEGFTGKVESATFATQAQQDAKGNVIHSTYAKIADKSNVFQQTDINRSFANTKFHNQEDMRLRSNIQLKNKDLDDVAAIGFSFVYTDSNNVEHYLEAHGVKSTPSLTETVAPSITSPHTHIACQVALSDKRYADGVGADAALFVGSITVELTTLGDGSLCLRFIGEHLFALTEGVLTRITNIASTLYDHCVLKDVFVYVL